MSLGVAKLRGAVTKVMADNRDQPGNDDQLNIWTEVAKGFKKAEGAKVGKDDAAEMSNSRHKMRILITHLDSVYYKPNSSEHGGVRFEDFVQLEHLEKLKRLFETFKPSREPGRRRRRQASRPRGCLTSDEFKVAVAKAVGEDRFAEQLDRVFFKLDTNNNGFVSWTEFCNYMMLYLHEADRLGNRVEPPFKSDPRLKHVLHNKQEPSARLLLTDNPTRPISVSKHGCLLLWDCQLKLESRLETQQVAPTDLASNAQQKRLFHEWVNDAVYMENCHKLCLCTTGREIKFFDVAANTVKEEYTLYGLRSVPTVMKTHHKKEAANTASWLIAGDDQGCLLILVFKQPLTQLFDLPPDPNHLSQRVWFQELDKHSRCVEWQYHESVHTEAVNDLIFLPESSCVVSCSTSPSRSVVVYDIVHKRAVYIFKLRRGAECFDFSRGLNLLITGSTDHLIRLWNPYMTGRHTGLLEGHTSSVLSVRIHEAHGYALSYAGDGIIKAWDVKAQACVQTVPIRIPYAVADKMPEHLNNPLTLHAPTNTVYVTISDNIVQFRLGKAADPVPGLILTHKEQLCTALYNPLFKQVTTAADDSTLTTWDVETGNKCLAFENAHDGEEVTCVAYDPAMRRLLTGSRHGGMKVWNFQTGQLLHELQRTADAEITGMSAVPLQQRILTVGWSRHIVCYGDSGAEEAMKPAISWKGGVHHDDDILTSDFCAPDLFATGGYDGAIVVWSLEYEKMLVKLRDGCRRSASQQMRKVAGTPQSGQATNSRPNSRHRLVYQRPRRSPAPVDKLLFLRRRVADKRQRESGLLVTSEEGLVRFWRVHGAAGIAAEFPAAGDDECALGLAASRDNRRLLAGDTAGRVRCWHIDGFACGQGDEILTTPPPLLHDFSAHEAALVSVDFAELSFGDFVVTASVDRTAKLFSIEGEIVGTFGQPHPWELSSRKTWRQAKIDRQKFFESVDVPSEERAEDSLVTEIGTAKDENELEKDENEDESKRKKTLAVQPAMKTRSQTMPAMSEQQKQKQAEEPEIRQHTIGVKAEKDFERIRVTRSDRRSEFGNVSSRRDGANAAFTAPYSVLKTSEIASHTMPDNLPQPSWKQKSKTTVGMSNDFPERRRSASSSSSSNEDDDEDAEEGGRSHRSTNRHRHQQHQQQHQQQQQQQQRTPSGSEKSVAALLNRKLRLPPIADNPNF